MFVTNWISPTKIQKISEITNFFRHYFLSRTEVFYIHKDYGNNEEPLYAKAIELITGTNPAPQTRSAVVNTLDGKTYKLPAIFRPGHDGMLMPARHAE